MENWYLPITLLPGIALMLLSTTNLMVALSDEINGYLGGKSEDYSIMNRKLIQLKLLNNTMVLFYVAVSFLTTSGLLGGLNLAIKTANYLSIAGIVIFLLGIICLIAYSFRGVNIRQDQFNIGSIKKNNKSKNQ